MEIENSNTYNFLMKNGAYILQSRDHICSLTVRKCGQRYKPLMSLFRHIRIAFINIRVGT